LVAFRLKQCDALFRELADVRLAGGRGRERVTEEDPARHLEL
jgi:hypothetical protein